MFYQYKYKKWHLDLMKEQVWEAKEEIDIYSRLSEREHIQIKDFLPVAPKVVVDLGGGLGRGAIHLNKYYRNPLIKYFILDRDGETGNTGAFDPKEDEYYNDFEVAEDFCKTNGLFNVVLFDTEKENWNILPKADLIVSRCSFGMHVSIERYIDRILSICASRAVCIFGTRGGGYGPDSFADRFEKVDFIPDLEWQEDKTFPMQNWLILSNPR